LLSLTASSLSARASAMRPAAQYIAARSPIETSVSGWSGPSFDFASLDFHGGVLGPSDDASPPGIPLFQRVFPNLALPLSMT
jgi:hypothetical protein